MRKGGETGASDRTLADAVGDHGDEDAFRELYRRHTPRLFMLVLRLVGGSEADAEDVTQETWIRACEGMDGFRWDSAYGTWLRRIGVNVAVDFLRRRGRDPVRPSDSEIDFPVSPLPLDERIDLEGAIAALPDGYRQVVVLHDIEGMTHSEIGQLLGVTEGTTKKQLFNARKLLRRRLAPRKEEIL